ncbi:MAG: DUF1573 domain-containing protein [Muribaculaceae bacterium]|nr:DUF1573 domain-containing protein [Muribaculaceae bacterium]
MSRLRFHIVALFIAIAVGKALAADDAGLVFTDTIHDFGEISVRSGYNTCQFHFVNHSDSTIQILGALSSCGCAIPEYPRQGIEPGQSGVVSVTYNTLGRPAGPFERSVLLILSGDRPRIVLRLRGKACDDESNLWYKN